jgi:hypothetical protein
LTHDILPGLLAATDIVGAHVCRADLEVSKVKTAEQKGRACGARDRSALLGWKGFIKLPGSTALRQPSKGVPSSAEP